MRDTVSDEAKEQRTPATVENEITQTRAELDHTLDEIGRRLSPQEIKERAVDYAKDSALEVTHAVQRRPLPLVLVCVVAGAALWLRHRLEMREQRERADRIRELWNRVASALPGAR